MTNDFDLKNTRKQLNALRSKHGADSPIGHRCSNLMEQLENYQASKGEHRAALEKHIAKSVADLAKLSAKNAEDRA